MTFSDDYVAYDPGQKNILGDMRYSMLPTSIRPLWGIAIDSNRSEQRADYQVFRDRSKSTRQRFMDLLMRNSTGTND